MTSGTLKPRLSVLTKHYDDSGHAVTEALSRLLDAAVEPTTPRSKAYVRSLVAEVHNAELAANTLRELEARWDAEYDELAAKTVGAGDDLSTE